MVQPKVKYPLSGCEDDNALCHACNTKKIGFSEKEWKGGNDRPIQLI